VTKQRTIVDKSAQAPGSRYRIAAYNAIGISPAATVKAPKH
jgi:hypothetical protein